MTKMIFAAWLAKNCRTWRPTADQAMEWIRFLIYLVNETRAFQYNIKEGIKMKPFLVQDLAKLDAFQVVSMILDMLKSFASDLGLTRYLASSIKRRQPRSTTVAASSASVESKDSKDSKDDDTVMESKESKSDDVEMKDSKRFKVQRPDEMMIGHAFDFHCRTAVDMHYDPDLVEQICRLAPASAPFKPLHDAMFGKVTGRNPRKADLSQMEKDPFVQATRKAQSSFLTSLFAF